MRVRGEHWEFLVNFAEMHPEIITNRYTGPSGRKGLNALWESLKTSLNSLGFGEKSVEGWRKALTDWKSKTKTKAAQLKSQQTGTGGGPHSNVVITPLEDRLLQLMGVRCVEGDPVNRELGFGSVEVDMQETNTENSSEASVSANIVVPQALQDHIFTPISRTGKAVPEKKQSSRRRRRQDLTSQKLLDISRETQETLQSIDNNLSSLNGHIADMCNSLRDLKDIFLNK